MKNIFLTLIIILFSATVFAGEIEAKVVFENLTNKELTLGEFTIINSNRKIEVTTAKSFKITLPEKGKYQFSFFSDEFDAYTFYPTHITDKKNIITIRLVEKKIVNSGDKLHLVPLYLQTKLTDEQMEKLISQGTLNFIMHGLNNSIPEEYVLFKAKYGIGLIKENCAIDPFSFKKAAIHNQIISDYLNRKFGTAWSNELEAKPYGIK